MPAKTFDYSEELAIELCSRIAEGRSLRSVCSDEDMPGKSLVFKWLSNNEQFCDHYTRAREALLASHEQDIIELADDIPKDATAVDVAKARLQIDSRKWIMSKIAPKKYGEKVEQTHVGDPDKPVGLSFTVTHVKANNE